MTIHDAGVRCVGCRACEQVCPGRSIALTPDKLGFLYPQIVGDCTECGVCTEVCPALGRDKHPAPDCVMSAAAKDPELRLKSSSGGVFTLLAETILNAGGAVFGCAFDAENNRVTHRAAFGGEELAAMRGSKYVQSDTLDTYSQTRKLLDSGKPALYCGTPCQIAGLRKFLGKDYENLLTIDLLCFGAPSPGVFKTMLEELGKPVSDVRHRDKRLYGTRAAVSYGFADGSETEPLDLAFDPFTQGFMTRMYMRECCSECSYTSPERVGDITLGDFWGADASGGTSLALINSVKGAVALTLIEDKCELSEVTLERAAETNPALKKSLPHNPRRAAFVRDYGELPRDELIKRYLRPKYYLPRYLLRKVTAKLLKRS